MKTLYTVLMLTMLTLSAFASDGNLDKYISEFDYFDRIEMKINSQELIDLLEEGKAQLIDIRFKEEYSA